MSITKLNPRTIHLAGPAMTVNDLIASEVITPGHLVERFNSTGVFKVRKHATAGGFTTKAVAFNQSMLNKGIDDTYAVSDLVELGVLPPGSTAYMLVASGQNIVQGTFLESAGDGTLRAFGAGTRLFMANESVDNSVGIVPARIRVEAL